MAEIIFKTLLTAAILVAFCSVVVTIEMMPDAWRDRATRAFAAIVSIAIAVTAIYLFFAGHSEARDLDGAAVVLVHDPLGQRADLNQWFDELRSKKGMCCSNQDGALVKDADWDTVKGADGISHYRVRIGGEWVAVPDNAVVEEPNKYGQAMVWGYPIRSFGPGAITGYDIRCFMPGVMM